MEKLTQELVKELLDYDPDTGVLRWKERGTHFFKEGIKTAKHLCKIWNSGNAGKEAFTTINSAGFPHGCIQGKHYNAHSVIWLWMTGEKSKYINHKNGNRADNRFCNLEERGDNKSEKVKVELTFDFVWSILDYKAETGVFYWKQRSADLFVDGKYPKERVCEIWNQQFAGKEAFTKDTEGYVKGEFLGIKVSAHRLAWFMSYGYWPKVIDHENGDTSDNRLENLRNVTHQTNCTNQKRRTTNKSGKTGVRKNGAKWVAAICFNYESIHIGSYDTFEEACLARDEKERELGFHENHDR